MKAFYFVFFSLFDRPAPPLPQLHLSEEMVNEVATFVRTNANYVLSASQDIALGKDSRLFLKVAACLWIISVVGGLTDFLTLSYASKSQVQSDHATLSLVCHLFLETKFQTRKMNKNKLGVQTLDTFHQLIKFY